MPYYDTLPSDWQTEIEKKTGMRLQVEVVYDPEDQNLLLTGKYNLISMSPFEFLRDIDIQQSYKNVVIETILTFNDPDHFFSTRNTASPFHNLILTFYEDTASGTNQIKITKENDIDLREGEIVLLKGYDYDTVEEVSETVIVNSLAESASYYILTCNKAIENNYKAGSFVYTKNSENKFIQVRLKNPNCTNWISLFKGTIIKPPESVNGQGIITASNLLRRKLSKILVGAETGTDDKLMVYDTDGSYVDSVNVIGDSIGTLDRTQVDVLSDCRLGQWKATFLSATQFVIDGPGVAGLYGNINYGYCGGMTLSYPSISICQSGNYLYSAGFGDLQIIDVSDPENPSETFKDINFFGLLNQIASAITGTTLVVGFFNIYTVDVSVPATPSITDTLAATHPIWDIKINGNYAYCGCYSGYVDVYDISNPANISLADSLKIGTGIILGISINGNYLYAVSSTDQTVYVIDISTPTAISLTGSLNLGYDCKDISHDGTNHVYITCGTDKALVIVDVTNPASPVKVGELEGAGYPNYLSNTLGIYANGNYAYIISIDENAIAIVDCTTKASPEILEAILSDDGKFTDFGDTYRALFVNGEYVYGYSDNDNLFIYRLAPSTTSRPGGDQVRINPPAWGGTWAVGDQVTFITAKNYKGLNPASILYDLEISKFGLDSKDIWASSFFETKNIGTLKTSYAKTTTAIQIKILQPAWIKTNETLIITEGSTTEEVTVTSGNLETSQYPDFISLTVSALSNDYTHEAIVTWKIRGSADTDFNLDAVYNYCDTNNLTMYLTLDTEMRFAQAIETVLAHCDAYTFSDNWGRDKVAIFKTYSNSDIVGTLNKSTNLAKPNPEIRTLESANRIKVRYGYNYKNHSGRPLKFEKLYPSKLDINVGSERTGIEKEKLFLLPGFFDEDKVDFLIEQKYNIWKVGPNIISFHSILHCLCLMCGDIITVDSDYPDITTDVIIIGFSIQILDNLNLKFWGLDAKKVFKTVT